MKIDTRMTFLLVVAPLLVTCAANSSTIPGQPLKAMPELIGTRYCYGDAQTFSVGLKLRVKYVNQTEKSVLLDKEIGRAWYAIRVAKNLQDLAAGKYEYNPNIDWFFTDKDKLPDKPKAESPDPDFIILKPGQAFESDIDAYVVAQYENAKPVVGSVRPGVHVFQMAFSAWNHPGEGSEFAKSWQKFGELFTGMVTTDPLQIQIPSKPKLEADCK